jgi:hypothetical protein
VGRVIALLYFDCQWQIEQIESLVS